MLSSGGGNLSAGQAQLLAFARVFLANPQLVILDEASSRLDPATEALIERAIDKLLHNRTALIIAQVMLLTQDQQRRPVLLIDDFSSELDQVHQEKLLGFLENVAAQKIITAIEPTFGENLRKKQMFHVEHGEISPV